jgi:hypothetical protein
MQRKGCVDKQRPGNPPGALMTQCVCSNNINCGVVLSNASGVRQNSSRIMQVGAQERLARSVQQAMAQHGEWSVGQMLAWCRSELKNRPEILEILPAYNRVRSPVHYMSDRAQKYFFVGEWRPSGQCRSADD